MLFDFLIYNLVIVKTLVFDIKHSLGPIYFLVLFCFQEILDPFLRSAYSLVTHFFFLVNLLFESLNELEMRVHHIVNYILVVCFMNFTFFYHFIFMSWRFNFLWLVVC